MDRSPGFGSIIYDLIRAINTRFRFGSVSHVGLNLAINNNSLDRSTKSTTSRLKSLCLLVNIGFQVLFHSPPGVLFTFPSRYYFTIGHQVVFSLTGWSPLIHTRFHVPRATLDTAMWVFVSCTGLSPSVVLFSKRFYYNHSINYAVLTPITLLCLVWALPISLATTFGIECFLSLPVGTKMFQFPTFPSHILLYSYMDN